VDKNLLTVLLAEDSEDDLWLMLEALKNARLPQAPMVVRDGVEAIEYLAGHGKYADRAKYPFPFLFFLDLNMPRKNGFEVLEWWRREPREHHLTTIVLTSSVNRADIERAYRLDAVSYLCKPTELSDLNEMVDRLLQFWSLVQRPP
jgi:CheY-like chemotaxis protein